MLADWCILALRTIKWGQYELAAGRLLGAILLFIVVIVIVVIRLRDS